MEAEREARASFRLFDYSCGFRCDSPRGLFPRSLSLLQKGPEASPFTVQSGKAIARAKRSSEDFDDWEARYHEQHRPSRNRSDEEGDKKHEAMHSTLARPPSLHDYLSDQLALVDSTPEQLRLLRFLITHLNEKGYLTRC